MKPGLFLMGSFLIMALMLPSPIKADTSPTTSASQFETEVRKTEEAYKADPANELLRTQLLAAYQQMSALLVKEDNFNDALHYLEWAEQLERGGASSGSNSGDGYFVLGVAELEKGNLRQAQDNFDRAVALKPNDENVRKSIGTVLHNFGVEKLNKKQYKESLPFLELSVKYYDKIQNTWEVLGDLAYMMQDLRKAQEYWQKALVLGSTLGIKAKLEKLQREADVELNLAQYGASHFIIRYKRSNEAYQGHQLKELLNDAYRVVAQDLNHYPDVMIPVILYDQKEFEQIMDSPHWSAGVYDGKIRLPAYEEGKVDAAEFKRVIHHELTHAFIVEIAGNACPIWLNEGLAQFEENKVSPIRTSEFMDSLAKGQYFNYEQLEGGLANLTEQNLVAVFYQQSFLMTKFLIDRYRIHRVKEMLGLLRDGAKFEEALRQTTGLSIESFQKKWLETVR